MMQKYRHACLTNQMVMTDCEVPGYAYYRCDHADAEIARLKAESDLLKAALRWLAEHCKLEDALNLPGKVTSDVAPYIFEIPGVYATVIAEAVQSGKQEEKAK